MSLRKAINDKCKECIYDPRSGDGNWRQQVTACTSPKCPLYPVRPISKPKPPKVVATAENRFVVDYMGQNGPTVEGGDNE